MLLFNETGTAADMSWTVPGATAVHDLWADTTAPAAAARVPAHGVAMFRAETA